MLECFLRCKQNRKGGATLQNKTAETLKIIRYIYKYYKLYRYRIILFDLN